MLTMDDVGSQVVHTYQIYNDGPWKAQVVSVTIMWPFQVKNDKPQGKWLLYLEEEPTIERIDGELHAFIFTYTMNIFFNVILASQSLFWVTLQTFDYELLGIGTYLLRCFLWP